MPNEQRKGNVRDFLPDNSKRIIGTILVIILSALGGQFGQDALKQEGGVAVEHAKDAVTFENRFTKLETQLTSINSSLCALSQKLDGVVQIQADIAVIKQSLAQHDKELTDLHNHVHQVVGSTTTKPLIDSRN